MNRRKFVAASVGASLVPGLGTRASAGEGAAGAPAGPPQILELRRYRLRFGPMEARFAEYQKNVLVPALNRAGIKPVGAFSVSSAPTPPRVYLLLPHPNAESVVTLGRRLVDDAEYQRGAASLPQPARDRPALRAARVVAHGRFDSVPAVEVPAGPRPRPRASSSCAPTRATTSAAGLKKIEMFEKAGEIADLPPGRPCTRSSSAATSSAPSLPSLTYMLVFADMAAREKAWAAFREDPEWVKLRATPGYANAEILTNITNLLLRPTDYSQI